MPAGRFSHVLRRLSPRRVAEAVRAGAVFRRSGSVIAAYTGLRRMADPETVVTRSGLAFTVHGLDDLVTLWGIFARRDYRVTGHETLIVDAGANFGAFSLFAARTAPTSRIYSLEPVRTTFDRLAGHITANGLQSRITPLALGIAGTSGDREIRVGEIGTYSSFYSGEGRSVQTVHARSLADLLRDIGDPTTVDLIKMDCEGAEMEAILGADESTLRRFVRIAIEYHTFAGFKEGDVLAKLQRCGFKLIRHAPDPAYGSGLAELIL